MRLGVALAALFLAGRTQMLVRMAGGTARGIDGTTQVPAGHDSTTAPRGERGHAAVAIPGTVAALAEALAVDPGLEPAFTTHISVADTFGNAVALSQSVGPTLGARVVTPGLGFVYASTLGGYLAGSRPGYRPFSSQAPLVAVRQGAAGALEGLGYPVTLREPDYFARLNAVELVASRTFRGVGEPRWSESAAGGPHR